MSSSSSRRFSRSSRSKMAEKEEVDIDLLNKILLASKQVNSANEDLSSKLKHNQDVIDQLAKDLSKLKSAMDEKTFDYRIKFLEEKVKERNLEINRLKDTIQKLSGTLAQREDRIDKLSKEKADAVRKLREKLNYDEQELDNLSRALQSKHDRLTAQNVDILTSKIKNLQAQAQEKEERMQELSQMLSARSAEENELIKDLKQKKLISSKLSEMLQQFKDENSQLKQEISEIESEKGHLEKQLKEHERIIFSKDAEETLLEDELYEQEEVYAKAAKVLQKYSIEIDKLKQLLEKKDEEQSRLHKEIDEHHKRLLEFHKRIFIKSAEESLAEDELDQEQSIHKGIISDLEDEFHKQEDVLKKTALLLDKYREHSRWLEASLEKERQDAEDLKRYKEKARMTEHLEKMLFVKDAEETRLADELDAEEQKEYKLTRALHDHMHEKEKLIERLQAQSDELDQKESDIRTLRKKLEELSHLEDQQSRIHRLETILKTKDQERTRLIAEIEKMKEASSKLIEIAEDHKEEADELRQKLELAEIEEKKQARRYEELEKKHKALLEVSRAMKDKEIRHVNEMKAYKKHTEDRDKRVSSLIDDVRKLQTQIHVIDETNKRLSEKLQRKDSLLASVKQELDTAKQALKKKDAQYSSLAQIMQEKFELKLKSIIEEHTRKELEMRAEMEELREKVPREQETVVEEPEEEEQDDYVIADLDDVIPMVQAAMQHGDSEDKIRESLGHSGYDSVLVERAIEKVKRKN